MTLMDPMDPTLAVWRFELLPHGNVQMPFASRVLSVAAREGRIDLWALVDPNITRSHVRRFLVVGTGHEVPQSAVLGPFVGTVVMEDGLVFHVWEADR